MHRGGSDLPESPTFGQAAGEGPQGDCGVLVVVAAIMYKDVGASAADINRRWEPVPQDGYKKAASIWGGGHGGRDAAVKCGLDPRRADAGNLRLDRQSYASVTNAANVGRPPRRLP